MILEAYSQLLRDPNHWAFELTLIFIFDVLIGLVVWPFIDTHLHEGDDGEHMHAEAIEDLIEKLQARVDVLEKGFVTPKLGDLCAACKHPFADVTEGEESCEMNSTTNYCQCACWSVLRGGTSDIRHATSP